MISLIAAVSKNNVIGTGNALPWHLPSDLEHFKNITMGKIVIMGSRTWESLPGNLKDRMVIVITKEFRESNYPNVTFLTIDEVKTVIFTSFGQEYIICGGAQIYEEFLPMIKRMYLTEVDVEIVGDDLTYFPEIDWFEWETKSKTEVTNDNHPYSISVFERI